VLDFLSNTDEGRRVRTRLRKRTRRVRRQSGNSGSGEREEEKRVEAEELGAGGEEQPLFLPTPSFMASAEEE
jgi:hypothetical protein